jgi:nickel-dependent lactate racemase
MNPKYYLYHSQDKKEHFDIPSGWTVAHFLEGEEGSTRSSVEQMTEEALASPSGTPPFSDLVSRAERIAILVDDATRPTPVEPILARVLAAIGRQGFPREKITIVAATGTHEPMTDSVFAARLGGNVAKEYKVIQHNAWQKDLVPIKIPNDPRTIKVNPVVGSADLRIGISSILPHAAAGYGGGPKIIVPGVSSFEFVRDHHMTNSIKPGSVAGRTEGNPFHEEVMKAAKAVGLQFSINCVYDRKGQILRVIGGSLETAFGEAVQACRETLGHRFEEKVDVTITSAFPHTHGHQFFKGLSAATTVTRPNGAVLLIAPISAPISRDFINSCHEVRRLSGGNPQPYVIEHLEKGVPFLPDKSIDFNMAMSAPFRVKDVRVIVVSAFIPKDEAEVMGLEHAPTLEAGIGMLEESYPNARVAIFPSGALIIPLTAWES